MKTEYMTDEEKSARIAELERQLIAANLLAANPDDLLRERLAAGPGEEADKRAREQQEAELERQRLRSLEPDVELCHRFAKTLEETLQIRVPVKSNVGRGILALAIADVQGAIERLRRFEAK